MSSPCPDENALAAYAGRELVESVRATLAAHLDGCGSCRRLLSDLVLAESAPPVSASRAALMVGDRVAHYLVLALLGRGGMGEVYRARDLRLQREVALKVIRAQHLGGPQAMARFLAEARATARFNHPHIVTLYEVGEHQGQAYMALELLTGDTLRSRLQAGALPLTETLGVARAVAAALVEAHQAGVLHGDLTAANVMLLRDGRVRVLDFGLAQPLRAEDDALHEPAGTPPYMAPEQWRGTACSDRTDSFALGVLLCEMLSGRHPLQLESGATRLLLPELRRIVAGPEALPSVAALAELPAAALPVAALADRCLRKVPAERPAAAELLAALDEVLARRAAPPKPTARRQRRIAALVGLALVGLALYTLPLVAAPQAGLVLATNIGVMATQSATFRGLCAGLQRVTRAQCLVFPLLSTKRRALQHAPGAALVLWLGADGRVALHPRVTPLFPLGSLAVPRPSRADLESFWDTQGRVFAAIAQVSAAQGGAALEPVSVPLLRPERDGEEQTVLGAFARYYAQGPGAPSGDALDDPELRALQRVAQRCLAGAATWLCPLAYLAYAARSPASSEALEVLEALRQSTVGRPALLAAVHIGKRVCASDPAAAARAVEPLWRAQPQALCEHLRWLDVAACTVAAGRRLGRPVPAWLQAAAERPLVELAGCDPLLLAPALGERGRYRFLDGRFAEAVVDYQRAYQLERQPAFQLTLAEALLNLPGRSAEVLAVVDEGAVRRLSDESHKLLAALWRYLATRAPLEAEVLLALYARAPLGFALFDDEGSRALLCREAALCRAFAVLRAPKGPRSEDALREALGTEPPAR